MARTAPLYGCRLALVRDDWSVRNALVGIVCPLYFAIFWNQPGMNHGQVFGSALRCCFSRPEPHRPQGLLRKTETFATPAEVEYLDGAQCTRALFCEGTDDCCSYLRCSPAVVGNAGRCHCSFMRGGILAPEFIEALVAATAIAVELVAQQVLQVVILVILLCRVEGGGR